METQLLLNQLSGFSHGSEKFTFADWDGMACEKETCLIPLNCSEIGWKNMGMKDGKMRSANTWPGSLQNTYGAIPMSSSVRL